MRDRDGHPTERCQWCQRTVRTRNIVIGKGNLRVGPCCLDIMLREEADARGNR